MRLAHATLILALLLPAAAHPQEEPRPMIDPTRAVVIDGVIGRGNLVAALTRPLLEMAAKDPTKPVDIVINSPGGEIETGYLFMGTLDNLQGRGITVRCYVPTLAASMAFQILLHCNERYALENSLLLWHGARVYGGNSAITQEVAHDLYVSLRETNSMILDDLDSTLGQYLSADEIRHHFREETLHRGADLEKLAPGFLRSYKYIPGLLETLVGTTAPRSSDRELRLRPRSIIHIYQWGN